MHAPHMAEAARRAAEDPLEKQKRELAEMQAKLAALSDDDSDDDDEDENPFGDDDGEDEQKAQTKKGGDDDDGENPFGSDDDDDGEGENPCSSANLSSLRFADPILPWQKLTPANRRIF